jgi:phosphate transport system substrate-binding protein
LTWMMVYKKYKADKFDAIKKWMQWVLTDGQKLNPQLDYVSIPDSVTKRALAKLESDVKLEQ